MYLAGAKGNDYMQHAHALKGRFKYAHVHVAYLGRFLGKLLHIFAYVTQGVRVVRMHLVSVGDERSFVRCLVARSSLVACTCRESCV